MVFPDDLPAILEYRLGPVLIRALPRRPVAFVGSSGKTNATDICPQIPYGATGWRLVTEEEWRPLETLPASWMPFLNRERGTQHDPRPKRAEKELN